MGPVGMYNLNDYCEVCYLNNPIREQLSWCDRWTHGQVGGYKTSRPLVIYKRWLLRNESKTSLSPLVAGDSTDRNELEKNVLDHKTWDWEDFPSMLIKNHTQTLVLLPIPANTVPSSGHVWYDWSKGGPQMVPLKTEREVVVMDEWVKLWAPDSKLFCFFLNQILEHSHFLTLLIIINLFCYSYVDHCGYSWTLWSIRADGPQHRPAPPSTAQHELFDTLRLNHRQCCADRVPGHPVWSVLWELDDTAQLWSFTWILTPTLLTLNLNTPATPLLHPWLQLCNAIPQVNNQSSFWLTKLFIHLLQWDCIHIHGLETD